MIPKQLSAVNLTATLKGILDEAGPAERQELGLATLHYIKQIAKWRRKGMHFAAMQAAHEFADREAVLLQAGSTCAKGCAHCCHLEVDCSPPEARVIAGQAKLKGIVIDRAVLAKQAAALAAGTFGALPLAERRCVMLQPDNTCGVYEVRPLACRKYFVATPPEDCDTENNPGGKVGIFNSKHAEAMATAIGTVYNTQPLPVELLGLTR